MFNVTRLDRGYIVGTRAFFALADLEVDLLVFVEGGITTGFDLGVMHEQIGTAVVRANESETLTCVEPLYCTCTHCVLLGL